jgi:hypothetical protein
MARIDRKCRDGKKLIKHVKNCAKKDDSITVRPGKGQHVFVKKGQYTTTLYPDEMPVGTARSVTKALVLMGLLVWMLFTILKVIAYNPGVMQSPV